MDLLLREFILCLQPANLCIFYHWVFICTFHLMYLWLHIAISVLNIFHRQVCEQYAYVCVHNKERGVTCIWDTSSYWCWGILFDGQLYLWNCCLKHCLFTWASTRCIDWLHVTLLIVLNSYSISKFTLRTIYWILTIFRVPAIRCRTLTPLRSIHGVLNFASYVCRFQLRRYLYLLRDYICQRLGISL